MKIVAILLFLASIAAGIWAVSVAVHAMHQATNIMADPINAARESQQ